MKTLSQFIEQFKGEISIDTSKEYFTQTDGNGEPSYPILFKDKVIAWWLPNNDEVEVNE